MQAALSVARRVAEEMDTDVGAEVGYSVRFDERTSSRTRIVYLTGAQNTTFRVSPSRPYLVQEKLYCTTEDQKAKPRRCSSFLCFQ